MLPIPPRCVAYAPRVVREVGNFRVASSLGQVLSLLCTSVCPSVKWVQAFPPLCHRGDTRAGPHGPSFTGRFGESWLLSESHIRSASVSKVWLKTPSIFTMYSMWIWVS